MKVLNSNIYSKIDNLNTFILEVNMRNIHTDDIINNIKEMCIEANYTLASDVEKRIKRSI